MKDMKNMNSKQMITLHMKRSRKKAFIGIFPSKYRAEVVAVNLGWSGCWIPEYNKVRINAELFRVFEEAIKYNKVPDM